MKNFLIFTAFSIAVISCSLNFEKPAVAVDSVKVDSAVVVKVDTVKMVKDTVAVVAIPSLKK